MPDRRVVITGIGVVSALGRGRAATLEAVQSARSGIRLLQSVDTTPLSCRIGGEVDDADLGDSDQEFDRFARLALIAAREAAAQSGLADSNIDRTRVGTIIGTGLGGSVTMDAAYERLYKTQSRIAPTAIPRAMYNAATSAISRELQALGPAFSVVSACASGTHSVAQAAQWIRNGYADVVVAGAADAPLITGIIKGWESLRVLAIDNDDPTAACRPFSADRKGMVLAEGAGVFVLEAEEHARARGIDSLGEIAGIGLSSDAGHLTDPSMDGAARALEGAIRDARMSVDEISYINAHGTGTRANDPTETAAIRRVFGAAAGRLAVSSTKSMHGHAMGASGAIELALSLVALNGGVIPPTLNLTSPDPQCDLDYVANTPREGRVSAFLSNSFGFGGMNGVLAVRTRQ